MVYALQPRLDKLGERAKLFNSEIVDVTRDTHTESMSATPIQTEDAEEISPGVVLTRLDRLDFVVDAADYKLPTLTVPDRSDRIKRPNGDTYKLISTGDDEGSLFTFTTSSKKRIRIHGVLVRSS